MVFSLKHDPWLSRAMGYAAWRVERGEGGEPPSRLQERAPVFAYAKLDVADIHGVSQLTDHGFRVVDAALTFDGTIAGSVVSGTRFARTEDREAVSRIAHATFRFSRFHLDPLVPVDVANEIKSAWAANYFRGKRGDGMIVAEREGRIVGFLQLLWASSERLVIDLIGVDPAWQGQGVGRSMILLAAHYGTGDERVPTMMTVGTQAANIPSVRLYESLGFRLRSSHFVLHYHGAARGEE